MSATPATSTFESEIPLNHPIFASTDPDLCEQSYDLIDERTGLFNPTYRRRLSKDQQAYVWGLIIAGELSRALAICICGTRGTVSAYHASHYAHADKIHCHDIFSKCCGQALAVKGRWTKKRDILTIISETQVSINLVVRDLAQQVTDEGHRTPADVRRARRKAMRLSTRLLGMLSPTSLTMDYLDPANTSSVSVRVLVPMSSLSTEERRNIKARWHEIAGAESWCELSIWQAGHDVAKRMEWLFSGYERVLTLPGYERALLRCALKGQRFIRTRGRYYEPLTPEQLEAIAEAIPKLHLCPTCNSPLCKIPHEQRSQQTLETIEREYALVDWHSDHDPFHIQRVVNRGLLINNFGASEDLAPTIARAGPS